MRYYIHLVFTNPVMETDRSTMKVITIILGVLLAIGGVYCMFAPIATYATIGWLIGASMVIDGVARIVMWSELRKTGNASGWTLAGAIVSLLLGIFLLGSYVAQFAVDLFIAYLIAAWLVIGGITRIIAAFELRNLQKTSGPFAGSGSWASILAIGAIITILGVLCIFNPTAVMISVGFLLGLSIVTTGVALVVAGINS